MADRPIRILIVDDSAVIREIINDYISEAPGLEVAGKARDGEDALAKLESLKPDVITLDIQMPKMDGLQTLDAILQRDPVPVIMVSSLTQLGANITLDALDRGALDYVAKPENGAGVAAALRDELLRKIRTMAGTDVRRMLRIRKERAERMKRKRALKAVARDEAPVCEIEASYADKCIALGISTGGPPALTSLFETITPPTPPIVVVQHMPGNFTKPFAWRLNSISKLSIKEAESGDVLKPNHVLIAPGGCHLHLRRSGEGVIATVRDGDPVSGHKPSADVMMKCAAELFGDRCLGVIMTGMGRDGSDGCGAIRQAGGFTIGQDEATSDVYGMNKVAFVEGNIDRQFSLDTAAGTIMTQVKRLWGRELVK